MSFISQLAICFSLVTAGLVETAQPSAETLKTQELSSWKTVRSKRCSLKMPMTPYSSSHTNQVRGEQFNYDVLVAPVENKAVYILLVAEYPRAIPKNQHHSNLEQFLTWISSQNPENRLDKASLIRHQGHEGMDFVIRNGSVYFTGRLVIADSRVYLMAVECDEASMKGQPVGAYLESLELF